MSSDRKGSGGWGDVVKYSWLANQDARALVRKEVEIADAEVAGIKATTEYKLSEVRINAAIALKTEAEAAEIFERTERARLAPPESVRALNSTPVPLAIEDQRQDCVSEDAGNEESDGNVSETPEVKEG